MRLGIVTRRFWPLSGSLETEVSDLAETLKSQGHHIEVLTIQWERTWPRQFQLREIPVTRIRRSMGGAWGMFRFLRELKHRIGDAKLDGLIVYGLNNESWGVIRSLVSHIPMVVRIHWSEANRFFNRSSILRQRMILQRAKRLVIDSLATQRLIDSRINPNLLSLVPPYAKMPQANSYTLSNQSAARACLSDAHPILVVEPLQPLVVCISPLQDPAISLLIRSWQRVLDQLPKARLWILGDGPAARTVWDQVCDQELADSIVLPGCFDDLNEVLQAADLYFHAVSEGGDICNLTKAMSIGIPPISMANEDVARIISDGENGCLISDHSPQSIAKLICQLLQDDPRRAQLGRAAKRAVEGLSIDNWAQHFIEPLQPIGPRSNRVANLTVPSSNSLTIPLEQSQVSTSKTRTANNHK